MWETWVWSLGWEDPLEKEWLPISIFFPGEFHGQRSLVSYSLRDRKELYGHDRVTTLYLSRNWRCFPFQNIPPPLFPFRHINTKEKTLLILMNKMQEKWGDVPSDILEAGGKAFSRMGPAASPKQQMKRKTKIKSRTQRRISIKYIVWKKNKNQIKPLKASFVFCFQPSLLSEFSVIFNQESQMIHQCQFLNLSTKHHTSKCLHPLVNKYSLGYYNVCAQHRFKSPAN